jgi:RNA polymerase sigma-70 factor (ECF subfamily)
MEIALRRTAAASSCAGVKVEEALVRRLRAREESAFSELVTCYHGTLRRLARLFVSTEASAEELAQDTWLAVLSGIDRFEGRSSLKTWICVILVNRARTRAKREARMVPESALDDGGGGLDPAHFDEGGRWVKPPRPWSPEELLLNKEAVTALRAAIEMLPERQRLVVTLRDIEGLDAADVSSIVGVSETNVRMILHRARTRLRAALAAVLAGTARA